MAAPLIAADGPVPSLTWGIPVGLITWLIKWLVGRFWLGRHEGRSANEQAAESRALHEITDLQIRRLEERIAVLERPRREQAAGTQVYPFEPRSRNLRPSWHGTGPASLFVSHVGDSYWSKLANYEQPPIDWRSTP